MKTTPLAVSVSFLFGLMTLLPNAGAVVPPPDGGYPGFNTAEGTKALFSLTTGSANTAVGWSSLFSNTDGSFNTAVGAGTLLFNVGNQIEGDGVQNTAVGAAALLFNTTGAQNTAVGTTALLNNTTGGANTANGGNALVSNTTGDVNTAIGVAALPNNTAGSRNIALGAIAGSAVTTANNVICIGVPGANVSDSCFIGSIRGVTTQNADAIPVLIDSAGQLGTMSSSRRFKKEIKPIEQIGEGLHALKPVTFHYKSDTKGTPQFGLIAEEVAEVNPDLVVRDRNGEIYTVRYDAVNAMLLNDSSKSTEPCRNREQQLRS